MGDNLVPFWEKSYQEYDTITFPINLIQPLLNLNI